MEGYPKKLTATESKENSDYHQEMLDEKERRKSKKYINQEKRKSKDYTWSKKTREYGVTSYENV